jgi:hypothetical protein
MNKSQKLAAAFAGILLGIVFAGIMVKRYKAYCPVCGGHMQKKVLTCDSCGTRVLI